MTIINNNHSGSLPTLWPYIETRESGIRIEFLPENSAQDKGGSVFPFQTLHVQDPMTRIVKARLVTDAGSEISQLIVLIQRDRILPANNVPLPDNNLAVDNAWQQAFGYFTTNKAIDNSLIKLGGQLAEDNSLVPFQPLLYCRLNKKFIPLFCPLCGGLLDLCRNDDMLISAGLHSYSNSLSRYLFCPSCVQMTGESDFYSSTASGHDGGLLKNQMALVDEYKTRLSSVRPLRRFPCRDCNKIGHCHGHDSPVPYHFAPFALYPFHMLVFKSISINLDEIVPLMKRKSAPPVESPQTDDIPSLSGILRRIITQWQIQAEDQMRESNQTISVQRSPRTFTDEPFTERPATAPPFNAESPDLQETIIVPADSKRSTADQNDTLTDDITDAETVIIGAPGSERPKKDPFESKWTDHQTTHSTMTGTTRPSQRADNLAETIISSSRERSTPFSQQGGITPLSTTEQPEEHKSGRSRKRFVLKNIDPSHPAQSTPGHDGRNHIAQQPEERFANTFKMGSEESDMDITGKSIPPSSPETLIKRPGRDQVKKKDLAETIIVRPKNKDPDRE